MEPTRVLRLAAQPLNYSIHLTSLGSPHPTSSLTHTDLLTMHLAQLCARLSRCKASQWISRRLLLYLRRDPSHRGSYLGLEATDADPRGPHNQTRRRIPKLKKSSRIKTEWLSASMLMTFWQRKYSSEPAPRCHPHEFLLLRSICSH